MNVSCPECRTTYRIDPRKVPQGGIRARCIRCPGEFEVDAKASVAPEEELGSGMEPGSGRTDPLRVERGRPKVTVEDDQGGTPPDNEPIGGSYPAAERGVGARARESDWRDVNAADAAAEPDAADERAAELGSPAFADPVERGSDGLPPPPFGSSDPKARARRLARVLVSDIVVYHPERRERSLREGTIRQEFREEIRKSWEEYVAQVGNEIARETSYFQEALNEILAGGARVF